jgi:hypothetical protein
MKLICPCCNKAIEFRVTHNGRLSTGSVAWYYGTMLVTETVLYAGERPEDTRYRAQLGLELIGRDRLAYMSVAQPKFYPLALTD